MLHGHSHLVQLHGVGFSLSCECFGQVGDGSVSKPDDLVLTRAQTHIVIALSPGSLVLGLGYTKLLG